MLVLLTIVVGSLAVDANVEPLAETTPIENQFEIASPIDLDALKPLETNEDQETETTRQDASVTEQEQEVATTAPARTVLQNPTSGYGAHVLAYAWNNGTPSSIVPQDIVNDLARIGAHHAAYNPALVQQNGSIAASHIKTPTVQTTSSVVSVIISSGRPVSIKPIIDSDSLGGYWRGTFKPANAEAWFTSYFNAVEAQYAAAYQHGSRHLVVGTELSQLESTEYKEYWSQAIENIRQDYPGTYVSYDQNWDMVGADPAFASSLDEVSYSAYFPFNSDQDLSQQWRARISQIVGLKNSTGINRGIGEFGMSLTGTLARPYDEDKTGSQGVRPNPDLVQQYVAAGCQAMRAAGLDYTLWAGSYATEWISEGISIDATRSYYLGAEENAQLAAEIAAACR